MYSRRLSQRQMINVFILLGLSLVFLIAGAAPGAAKDYPSRPITINVGFPPGSGAGMGPRSLRIMQKSTSPSLSRFLSISSRVLRARSRQTMS